MGLVVFGCSGNMERCRKKPIDSFHKGLCEPREASAMSLHCSGLKCDTERGTFHLLTFYEQHSMRATE